MHISDTRGDAATTRIPVFVDKPGRSVVVETAQLEDGRRWLTLALENVNHYDEAWTWLTPADARKVAAALNRAARACTATATTSA